MTPHDRPGLSLDELVAHLAAVDARVAGDASTWVTDVRQDSRLISGGELFAARRGARVDGSMFVEQAVASGAAAVMAALATRLPETGVPVVRVNEDQLAIALAAEAVHHMPSRSVKVVAITGTNGKTTTASLVVSALRGAAARPARLGTLGYEFEGVSESGALTTPEADDVSRCLARARDAGATHMVLEASSIALSQRRVDALQLEVAAFSNLSQDHLDFHGTMTAYADAKQRLFVDLRPATSVVNVDDDFGSELAERVSGACIRVGRGKHLDVAPLTLQAGSGPIRGKVRVGERVVELETSLVGEHNVDNLLLTFGIALALGVDADRAAEGICAAAQVPGRLEVCSQPSDDILVLVDYAHTPDALCRVLDACRPLTRNRLVCVFGCGGDRDPTKRGPMGEVVGRLADRAIVSNDNPRSEDPLAIAKPIEAALAASGVEFSRVLDREKAIFDAVTGAEPGDVVLVAGKGHETYQILGDTTVDFDDREVARRALAERRAQTEAG